MTVKTRCRVWRTESGSIGIDIDDYGTLMAGRRIDIDAELVEQYCKNLVERAAIQEQLEKLWRKKSK